MPSSESPQRPVRRPLEKLVREVSAALNDPVRRQLTVQQLADELGEHPWRICDAVDVIAMLEYV
jgi:hypothetical protein